MKLRHSLLLIISIFLNSCQEGFSASPYVVKDYEGYENLNNINILSIISPSFKSPKVSHNNEPALVLGFISDTHYYYDETARVIDAINRDTSVSVVLHGGDITENGLPDEFYYGARELAKLHHPYLTAIGNHDHLGTGDAAFLRVFGEIPGSCSRKTSFSTRIESDAVVVRIIVWDNNVWEAGNSEPDFNWLKQELEYASKVNEIIVVLAHIPPWSDQFTEVMAEQYDRLVNENSVRLSIHGHAHHSNIDKQFDTEPFLNSSVRYAVIGSTSFESYMKAIITPTGLEIVNVKL